MEKYSQKNRPMAIITGLGEDRLLLVGLQGREGLSQLFSFQLDVLAPEPSLQFKDLLCEPTSVQLVIPGSGIRYIHGIVSQVKQKGRVAGRIADSMLIRYRMELVPRLWLLSQRFQSRILQHLSIPAILKQVLHNEWKLNVEFRIQQEFEPRIRCVQYRETDFAFISRLMEEEGIHYYFEHNETEHKLIISDNITAPPELAKPNTLKYDEVEGGFREESSIISWEKTQAVRPCVYTLWDHCFELPGQHLEAKEHMRDVVPVGKNSHFLDLSSGGSNALKMLEVYEYPGNYSQRFDGITKDGAEQPTRLQKIFTDNARTVKIRMQQQAAEALNIDGISNCGNLIPGFQFTLENHFSDDGSYLLREVQHNARLEGTYLSGNKDDFSYGNEFRCLPVAVAFRPPSLTPKPRVDGTQTATVVGPDGYEIYCDKYGRVKVQFHWDRTDVDKSEGGKHILHDSSCWIRVSQTWAGKGFGAIHIPRVGQEVIVDYLEGDPDKPIIVGCVYNAEEMPPYQLPNHKSHAGLKSHSLTGDSEEFSHLTFEDYKGSEHVHMHSQKDMTHSAENHLIQNVGNQHHMHVGAYSYKQVGSLPGFNHGFWIGENDVIGGTIPSPSGAGGSFGNSRSSPSSDNTGNDSNSGNNSDNSGSGDSSGSTSGGSPFFSVSPSAISTGWAANQDITYGWKTGNTCGLYTTLKLGVNLSTTINPFALDEFCPKLGTAIGVLAASIAGGVIGGIDTGSTAGNIATNAAVYGAVALVGGVLARNAMGVGNVVIGTNNSIHYGRKIDVHYGNNYAPKRKTQGTIYTTVSLIVGTIYSGLVLAEAFQPSLDSDSKAVEGAIISEAILIPTLFSVWSAVETEMTFADYLQLTSKATVAQINVNNNYFEIVGSMEPENIAQDVGSNPNGPATENGDQTLSSDSVFRIIAPMINLFSDASSLTEESAVNGIVIQANGSDEIDGQVLIYGTGKACLQGGGQAYVNCSTEAEVTGQVTIDCGAVGTISLQSGLTQEPNCVTLSPEGISLSSLVEIKASVEENNISMNPAMISLSCGPTSIEITPEGITLSCGPASIAITPEGVVITGPTVEVSGDAEVGISGAAIMIGG